MCYSPMFTRLNEHPFKKKKLAGQNRVSQRKESDLESPIKVTSDHIFQKHLL